MPDRKSSSTSNSSRTAAKVAVVVVIVIAIAGFVLAGLKGRQPASEQVAASEPTPEADVAPTAASATSSAGTSADDAVAPNIVTSAPSRTGLTDRELAKVRAMAETAKLKNIAVAIVVEEAQFALAQQRVVVVRQTLVDCGVLLARMLTMIAKVPQGALSAADAKRVLTRLQ